MKALDVIIKTEDAKFYSLIKPVLTQIRILYIAIKIDWLFVRVLLRLASGDTILNWVLHVHVFKTSLQGWFLSPLKMFSQARTC